MGGVEFCDDIVEPQAAPGVRGGISFLGLGQHVCFPVREALRLGNLLPEEVGIELLKAHVCNAQGLHVVLQLDKVNRLEFHALTGEKISGHNLEESRKETPYDLHFFVIEDDRAALYERIDARVDFMMEEGLYDEVAFLKAMGLTKEHVSMQGIGYKEILKAMDGEYSLEEAVRIIKRDSRHYAKRQLTWFRREKDAVHLLRQDFGGDSMKLLKEIIRQLEETTTIRAKEVGNPYE